MLLGWFEIIFVGFSILMLGVMVGFGIGLWLMHKWCREDFYECVHSGRDVDHEYYRARFVGETNPDRPF